MSPETAADGQLDMGLVVDRVIASCSFGAVMSGSIDGSGERNAL